MKLSLTIKILTVVLIAVFSSHAVALTTSPAVEITILSSSLGKDGDKFPEDLVKFWNGIPIEQGSKTIDIIPKLKLLRIDLADEKEFVFPKSDSIFDSLRKPDPRITLKKAHDFLNQSKLNKDFSAESSIDSNQKETIKNKFHTEIPTLFEVTKAGTLGNNQFKSVADLLVALKKQLSQDISTGSAIKYLIFYNLDNEVVKDLPAASSPVTPKAPAPVTANIEAKKDVPNSEVKKDVSVASLASIDSQEHVKQAMMYVTLAKANPTTHIENIKNALAEFDVAVKQEESQGRCFAKAHMDRGLAYWLDKKLNLAEKDLVKASECDAKDPIIFYNLASYYSATNKADLALDPLNKALDLGFKDCDILRTDSDLNNLRKMSEFKRALEQHSLFCLK
ncbi:MAG: hypothetical protein WCP66_08725 [Methylococcales bacterium]